MRFGIKWCDRDDLTRNAGRQVLWLPSSARPDTAAVLKGGQKPKGCERVIGPLPARNLRAGAGIPVLLPDLRNMRHHSDFDFLRHHLSRLPETNLWRCADGSSGQCRLISFKRDVIGHFAGGCLVLQAFDRPAENRRALRF